MGHAWANFEAGRSLVAVAPEPFVDGAHAYAEGSRNIGWTHVLVDHAFYIDFSNVDGCSAILEVVRRGLLLAN